MELYESENIFAFRHRGYPLFCPHCYSNVNLSLSDYKQHLEKYPSICMYCCKVWRIEKDEWVESSILKK